MPLTDAQRAYAAAYQTALVEDDLDEDTDKPNPDAFGITSSQAEMVENRVRKGTVDYDDMPAMLRPSELNRHE